MKSFGILAALLAVSSLAQAFNQDRTAVADPKAAITNFRYCDDEVSLSKVSSLSLTNCDDTTCVLNAREASRLVVVYTAGASYDSLDYTAALNGTGGSYLLTQGTGVEEVQEGLNYTIGVNFVVNGSVSAGDYTLRLLRQSPQNSTVDLCIELGLAVLNDDVEDLCDPDDCRLEGYCIQYKRCVRKEGDNLGRWEVLNCGTDLFWNPDSSSIHGGTCDYFVNLPATLQEKYRDDGSCILPCAWWQDAEDVCSPRYNYRVPFDNHTLLGRERDLNCPSPPAGDEPLYWDPSTLSCDRCSSVVDGNNNPCDCGVTDFALEFDSQTQ